jgi:hypothetical protein
MARLLPEGPEAELVAISISEHPEVAEAEHALRRLGRLLSCGPKGNRNVLRWTHQGQDKRFVVFDDLGREFDLAGGF